jgi:hypothetical protein
MRVLWILTAVAAVLAGVLATLGLLVARGELLPVMFAAALALAGVPYVFTRAVEALGRPRPGALPGPGYWWCPECAEPVRLTAKVCPHCGHRPTREQGAAV